MTVNDVRVGVQVLSPSTNNSPTRFHSMTVDHCQVAFNIVNQMHAMVAYWDADERCVFSNHSYQTWFDKNSQEMAGISMQELLGPALYKLNHSHIQGALRGEKQIFERRLTHSRSGETLRFLTTYTPDPAGDAVRGFSVHAVELPTQTRLQEWLPICSSCKDIRTTSGEWYSLEDYFSRHSSITFTHGLCPKCMPRYFPSTDHVVNTM